MRAITIINPGSEGWLEPAEIPPPEPAAGEILIKTAYAGVNRADLLQKQGSYRVPEGDSPLPGLEVSGVVADLGNGVTGWRVGDELCALTNGGGYAEYCVAPAGQCLPIPQGLSLRRAAALPEACFTVWMALFTESALKAGEILLVHGGASGVGTMAIQIAVAMGATVYATAGSDEKCRICERLGATQALNYNKHDFVSCIKEVTGGRGVDMVLDMVGGDYFQRNFSVLAVDGRMVTIAFLRGARAELNLAPLLLKRLSWRGAVLRPRSTEYKSALAGDLRQHVWDKIANGDIMPVIDSEFPLAEAQKAHDIMQQNLNIGKILLLV